MVLHLQRSTSGLSHGVSMCSAVVYTGFRMFSSHAGLKNGRRKRAFMRLQISRAFVSQGRLVYACVNLSIGFFNSIDTVDVVRGSMHVFPDSGGPFAGPWDFSPRIALAVRVDGTVTQCIGIAWQIASLQHFNPSCPPARDLRMLGIRSGF